MGSADRSIFMDTQVKCLYAILQGLWFVMVVLVLVLLLMMSASFAKGLCRYVFIKDIWRVG